MLTMQYELRCKWWINPVVMILSVPHGLCRLFYFQNIITFLFKKLSQELLKYWIEVTQSIFLQSRWECRTQWSQRSRPVVPKWEMVLNVLGKWVVKCKVDAVLKCLTNIAEHKPYYQFWAWIICLLLTISVLQACCAVTTEYGIPSDFNHFSTTGLLRCDHWVRHSQHLCKKIDCLTSNQDFNSTT